MAETWSDIMMTTRLRTYGWILGFILIFSFCLKLVEINEETSDNPSVVSRRSLSFYGDGIGLLLAEGESPLEGMLSKYGDIDLISALVKLIESDEDLKVISAKLSTKDGWGHPYNVEWRTNMVGVVSPMLSANVNPLFIWSSGSNGVNEYGNGDDIFDYGDWRIYKDRHESR